MTPKKTSKKSTTKPATTQKKTASRGKAAAPAPEDQTAVKPGSGHTVHVLGNLEHGVEEVDGLLAGGDAADLTLDFSACLFISVEGLEWLEEVLLRAESKQASVRLVNISPSVYKTFKVSRIDSILKACGGLTADGAAAC